MLDFDLGNASLVGIFLLMAGTLIRVYPIIQRNLLDAKERRESRYSERITKLEGSLKECQDECEDTKEALRAEIRTLHEQRLGDRHQNLQEQISLVSIIAKSVDNPLLSQILESLQSTKSKLPYILTGVVGDAQSPPSK